MATGDTHLRTIIPAVDSFDSHDLSPSAVIKQFPQPRPKRPGNGDGGIHGTHCVMRDRVETLEENDEKIFIEVMRLNTKIDDKFKEVTDILGEAPDIFAGTTGTGMSGAIYKIANVVMRDYAQTGVAEEVAEMGRASLTSLDFEEGEITKVQDRAELLIRAKVAEAELKAHKEAKAEVVEQITTTQKNMLEVDKLRIEKWKIVVGAVTLFFGPTALSSLMGYIPSLIKLILGH